jgi:hypothetical protein
MTLAGETGAWEAEWWGFDSSSLVACDLPPRDAMRHFPRAGLTVFRGPDDYLLITNGVVGTAGFGNHKHNDLLGFEYHAGGTPVLVDPGSFVYTSDPEARNLFRSTRSHNTVSVDGEEQNEYRPEWLFRMFEKASPEHLGVSEHDDRLEYRGRHHGYSRLPQPVVHERTFTWSRVTGALTIVDVLHGQGIHHLRWHFHFAPGVEIAARERGRFEIRVPRVVQDFSPAMLILTVPPDLRAELSAAWYSPSYGIRRRCVALDLDVETRVDSHNAYVFEIAS